MEDKKGYVGAIRQIALPREKVAAAEKHGKRLDDTSILRKVRDVSPLVYGTLDISDALDAHMSGVARTKGAKTACVHAYVQFPTKLINPDDHKEQLNMLLHAVKFINNFHGKDAVFAARLDRDESGRHGVDVFFMPRYVHTYKDGRQIRKASPSKFSKEQAKLRFFKMDKKTGEPILDLKGNKIGRDDVRAQGQALQAAWYEYLKNEVRVMRESW